MAFTDAAALKASSAIGRPNVSTASGDTDGDGDFNRSDDKGIEPESVVVGEVAGRLYAFVGLERDSGIVVLDVSDPSAPRFVTYATNRKFPRNPSTNALLACNDVNDCGDLGPGGLTFVPTVQSPTGNALLIVSNEVSSTTTIWEIR